MSYDQVFSSTESCYWLVPKAEVELGSTTYGYFQLGANRIYLFRGWRSKDLATASFLVRIEPVAIAPTPDAVAAWWEEIGVPHPVLFVKCGSTSSFPIRPAVCGQEPDGSSFFMTGVEIPVPCDLVTTTLAVAHNWSGGRISPLRGLILPPNPIKFVEWEKE